MSTEPWRKHYWRNTATNYLSIVTRIGAGLVLFRLLFQHLSHEQFGFYALLWSVFGYAILLDVGLGVAVQKAVAEKSATGDLDGLTRLVSTVVWSFAVLGVVLFVLGMLARPLFLNWIKLDPVYRPQFGAAYLVFMGALAVNFPLALFPEILRGVQRLDLVNWAVVGGLLVNLAVMSFALFAHWAFPVIVFISVATTILHEVVAACIARRLVPGLSLHPRHFHFPSVRGVLGFSVVAYLITCTNLIILKTDQAVISVSIGIGFVALYQLGYKASEIFNSFSRQLHVALSPAAAHLGAGGNQKALNELVLQTSRITFLATTPLYALCAVYLDPVIRLLSGLKTIDPQTFWVGEMLLFSTYSSLLTNSSAKPILVMCGWERPLLRLSLLEAGLNLGLSIVLVRSMGIAGVALGTMGPAVLVGWLGLVPMTGRFLKLGLFAQCREIFVPALAPVASSLLVLALLAVLYPLGAGSDVLACAWRGALVLIPVGLLGWPVLRRRAVLAVTAAQPVAAA
jgi:O-antigen/teichoic acid export membrane protein